MTAPLDEAIRLTVDYITNRAQHYFSIVRSKSEEGVLWFSFVYQHDQLADLLGRKKYCTADEAARSGLISVKKTAFLPIGAIMSTDAKPLLDMMNRCDRRQQFVAWFTLEMADGSGQPQVSKVIVVDTLFGSVPRQGSGQSAGAISQSRFGSPAAGGGGHRATTPNRRQQQQQQQQPIQYQENSFSSSARRDPSESAINDLRRDMQETAASLRQQQSLYAASTPGGGPPMATLGGGGGGGGGRESPSRALNRASNQQSFFGGHPTSAPLSPDLPPSSTSYQSQQQLQSQQLFLPPQADANYSHLLKVSLQISDSVAKLSQRMDTMSGQFSKFEQHVQKELYDLRMKVQRVDGDMAQIRPKMSEIGESTAGFGTRLAHLRQEMQAMFESVSKKVAVLSESVISKNLQFSNNGGGGGSGNGMYSNSNNNNNNSNYSMNHAASSSALSNAASYSHAMAAAEKVNMDELISRHAVPDHHHHQQQQHQNSNSNTRGGSTSGRNVSFADDAQSSSSFGSNAGAAAVTTSGGGVQTRRMDALDRLLQDSQDDSSSYDARAKAAAVRSMTEFKAQSIVDEFQSVAKDLKQQSEFSRSEDDAISVANLHRQKATLELARQSAANRSEAQAIAAGYMNERNKAIGASAMDLRGGVPAAGVPVPLEVSSSSVGAGPVVVSDSHQGLMFGGGGGGGGNRGGGYSSSLSDLLSNMERKLEG